MVGGGVVALEEGFEPLHHVVKLFNSSECRIPLILVEDPDGDPFRSVACLANRQQSAVWQITMDSERNAQNALDYIDVGIQNGDWVYLTQCEDAPPDSLRRIGLQMMTLQPDPKRYPRRELFRLWLVVKKPLNLNDTIHTIFPQVITKNALVGRAAAPPGSGCSSPEKLQKKLPAEPPLYEKEEERHAARRQAGRDSDSESDADEPHKRITGLWFYRAVDLQCGGEGPVVSANAQQEIFSACDANNLDRITQLIQSGQVDVNRAKKDGMTPLQYCCSRELVAAAQALLASGANPNQPRESDQCPPLFMCLESVELVQALIDAGANYNARFEGYLLEKHPTTAPEIARMIQELKASAEAAPPASTDGSSPQTVATK